MARVLLCDDAPFIRETMKTILQNNGHEIVGEASGGTECIELYHQHKPDIVFMDITLPDIDGIEATEGILSEDKDAIIIIVSALANKKVIERALKAGAKDFVIKPFQRARIVACVDMNVAKKNID